MELIFWISLLLAVGVFGFFIVLLIFAVKELRHVKDVEYGILVDNGIKYELASCSIKGETPDSYILECNNKSVKVSKDKGRFIVKRSPPLFLKRLVKVWLVDNNYVEKIGSKDTLDHKELLELRKLDTTSNYLLRKYQARIWMFAIVVIMIIVVVFFIYNYFENQMLMHPQPIIINQTRVVNQSITPKPVTPTTPPPR